MAPQLGGPLLGSHFLRLRITVPRVTSSDVSVFLDHGQRDSISRPFGAEWLAGVAGQVRRA
eukprot:6110312-Lingulodinium_polyedra.AAC.1